MKLSIAAAIIFLSTGLQAASISLIGDTTTIFAGDSAGLQIGIVSDDAQSPPSENLTGWQLSLEVRPDDGATGAVTFGAPSLPPTNYILDSLNFGLSSFGKSSTSLFVFDFNSPFSGGVKVPTLPGAALLDLTFVASADAFGSFGVFALGGVGVSEWADNGTAPVLNRKTGATAPIQPREFSNLKGVIDARLGTAVVSAVPEPDLVGSFLLAAFMLLLMGRPRRGKG